MTHATVHWLDPYVTLDYGDKTIDVQDALTCAVACDLLVDLRICVTQSTHNTLVFESSRDCTLAVVYLSGYSHFTYCVHEPVEDLAGKR